VALVRWTVAAPARDLDAAAFSPRSTCMWTAPSAPEAQPRAFRVSVTERDHGRIGQSSGWTQNRPAKYLAGLLRCCYEPQMANAVMEAAPLAVLTVTMA
jgi:hypothetical protein